MGYELYFETCNIFLPSLRIPSVNQGKFGKTSIRVRFVAARAFYVILNVLKIKSPYTYIHYVSIIKLEAR